MNGYMPTDTTHANGYHTAHVFRDFLMPRCVGHVDLPTRMRMDEVHALAGNTFKAYPYNGVTSALYRTRRTNPGALVQFDRLLQSFRSCCNVVCVFLVWILFEVGFGPHVRGEKPVCLCKGSEGRIKRWCVSPMRGYIVLKEEKN